jgi:hypothetical protein
MRRAAPSIGSLLLIVTSWLAPLNPAAAQDVLDVDLRPLIEDAARHRTRFAVEVPDRFSTSTHGTWTAGGATRDWTYSVRVPSAVSMSFYAMPVQLPASARLTVSGAEASSTYRASDVARASIWSRPLLGDTLTFKLTVSAADASKVRFEVVSLQAGYRGLSPGVPDHPYYKRLHPAKTAAAVPPCVQNYACNATDANRGPAKATVALLIANLGQCTGTLVNNTREDARPYVLTARHCENGELGGGAPEAAAAITVYWDAVTTCGEILGSLYSGTLHTQSGARTVAEQQDAWLIELDRAPEITDPYFAGWDATGGVFVGGYSVHHAMGRDQQFVAWHGQSILQHIPAAVLGAPYDSDFWGVVNSFGNVGAGASGGALFDPSNRVVANASLAYLIDGAGSDGVCPTTPPPAPSAATITAQYTALSAVWNSTADASSTTGSITMRSALDPDGTGRLVLDGMGFMPVQLSASTRNEQTERPVTLSWNVPWAQSCTATGGRPGDGWVGDKPPSGSAQVTELSGGTVQYELTCRGGDRSGKGSASVDWLFIQPLISLRGPSRPVTLGAPFDLRWDANVNPCTASGGLPGDGWAGAKSQPGQQTLQATQLGATTYSISCGTGVRVATTQVTVQVAAPSVTLSADTTRVRTGAGFTLSWQSDSDGFCNGSGGVPSWPLNTRQVQSNGNAQSLSSVAGTFTYTMTCSGGGLSASSSVTVEVVNEPPAATLIAVAPTQEIFEQGHVPADLPPNLLWTSNQTFCSLASLGPVGNTGVELHGQYPAGTATAAEFTAGHYEYEFVCPGAPIVRTSIEWVAAHPRIWLADQVIFDERPPATGTWVGGTEHQLWWTSNTVPCTASGGVPGDGWAGFKGNSVHAAQTVQAPTAPGTYTYSLTCGTGSSVASEDFVVTVPPPAVTLTATPTNPFVGQGTDLAWNATVFPCVANADGAGVNWASGNMQFAGRVLNVQTTPGTYTYTIRCGSGARTASASTQVTFRPGAPVELTASALSAPVNTPVTLTWRSESGACDAVGGIEGDGWAGPKPASGSMTVTSPIAVMIGYLLNCSAGSPNVVVTYTGDVSNESPAAARPSTTLSANRASQVAGQPVTLTWDSTNANACVATGGSDGDGWAGSVSLSGSMSVTRASSGSATYSITCTGATPASTSVTTVAFVDAPGTGGGNSDNGAGGGGGGALDRYLLQLLFAMAVVQIARRRTRVGLTPESSPPH